MGLNLFHCHAPFLANRQEHLARIKMTEINVGIVAKTTTAGIELSGFNTYHWKETIKAMGGKWQPATKTWVLPVEAVLQPLMPVLPPWVCCHKARHLDHHNKTLVCSQHYPKGNTPQPPRFQPLPKHAYYGRPCCSHAKARFDSENPQGPMWYDCPSHGTYKSCYTGD